MHNQPQKYRRIHHGRVDEACPREDRVAEFVKRGYMPVGTDGLTELERRARETVLRDSPPVEAQAEPENTDADDDMYGSEPDEEEGPEE